MSSCSFNSLVWPPTYELCEMQATIFAYHCLISRGSAVINKEVEAAAESGDCEDCCCHCIKNIKTTSVWQVVAHKPKTQFTGYTGYHGDDIHTRDDHQHPCQRHLADVSVTGGRTRLSSPCYGSCQCPDGDSC